jgi:hypothetical protein
VNQSKLLVATLALLAGSMPALPQEADARLHAFFQQYLEECFHQRPLEATRLGDHRFDARLDDLSQAARDGWLAHARKTLKELPRQVDYAKLSRNSQIDFEILRQELTRTIWLADNTHPFQEDPRTYNDYINDSVYLLLTQSTLPQETNVANSIARMAQIPKVVAAAKENLGHPPRAILETAIRQNRGAISFYESGIFELAGRTARSDALKAATAPVATLLKEYQKFLEGDLMSRATGEWRLGRKRFARKLELVLDAGFTANQVLAEAEAEFLRVRRDMYVIARQLWSRYLPAQPFPPDDAEGRRTTINRIIEAIGKEHGKPEDLVQDARATVDRIKAFIRERDLMRLPNPDRCQVIEMPEFRRGNSLAYLDNAPRSIPKVPVYARSARRPRIGVPARSSFLEIQSTHAPDSHHSRSLSGALCATGVFQPHPIAHPPRAAIGRLH